MVLALIGVFVGLRVPFNKLVNIVYVINGYVGIVLLGAMLLKTFSHRKNKATSSEKVEQAV